MTGMLDDTDMGDDRTPRICLSPIFIHNINRIIYKHMNNECVSENSLTLKHTVFERETLRTAQVPTVHGDNTTATNWPGWRGSPIDSPVWLCQSFLLLPQTTCLLRWGWFNLLSHLIRESSSWTMGLVDHCHPKPYTLYILYNRCKYYYCNIFLNTRKINDK